VVLYCDRSDAGNSRYESTQVTHLLFQPARVPKDPRPSHQVFTSPFPWQCCLFYCDFEWCRLVINLMIIIQKKAAIFRIILGRENVPKNIPEEIV
jgi:hypothetical protein